VSLSRPLTIFLLCLVSLAHYAHAQGFGTLPDSLPAPPTPAIFQVDTAAVLDTVAAPGSGIDSVVSYSAKDSIVFFPTSKRMFMFGETKIKHKEMGLNAEQIDMNWNTSQLDARGVTDSTDSTGYRGRPEMIDAGETYNGTQLSYNFDSKKGRISVADTKIGDGFYYGDKIKKVDVNVLYVGDGRYTTCDLEHPHYYFGSSEMKVQLKDKIVARPVTLYIDDVPIFALPFGVFPNQRGRRSGIIAPAYGEDSRGRFLEHLGYYWAISDYTDVSFRADGYTGGSWRLLSDFRYALRYVFTGSLSGFVGRDLTGESTDPSFTDQRRFSISMNHSHTINPTTQLIVNATVASATAYRNSTYDPRTRFANDNILSNITFTKRWEGATAHSLSINMSRSQRTIAGDTVQVDYDNLPAISFSRQQSFPFRFGKTSSGGEGYAWYELISYSYSGDFRHALNDVQKTPGINVFEEKSKLGARHSIPISASAKVGYFSFTPFFNYSEVWYNKGVKKEFNMADSAVVTSEFSRFSAVRSYNMGISASTKIYGIIQPGIAGITGLRHQITPTLTYSFNPDFSRRSFGYYDSYVDANGVEQKYYKYENGLYGGPPAREQQILGLNIGNVFEMKTASRDSAGQENKFRLLNLGVGVSYDFVRDSLKFSEIGMNYNTTIGNSLNLSGNASFNMYQFAKDQNNPQTGRRINKFLLKEEGKLAQLTNFGITLSTSFSGEKKSTKAGPIVSEEDSIKRETGGAYVGLNDQIPPDFSIPWKLDLSWTFSQNQSNPDVIIRNSSLSAALGFNLTEFWKFETSTSYDLVRKEFLSPRMSIYRDLHCWEMSFSWEPIGQFRQYRLEIRLKSPLLQDVKVTKTDRAGGF